MAKTVKFDVTMRHDEDTLVALSHMQYDLFCTRNRVARSFLSLALVIIGLVYSSNWWSLLIIGYGCYLTTSTYASANRTAHKLAEQLKAAKLPFPSSQYLFESGAMRIVSLPDKEELEPLPYDKVAQLGEDMNAFYLFRDQFGGYMIPKEALGDKAEDFRRFVEEKAGQTFHRRLTPIRRLRAWLRRREDEPEHL